jgi:peroxidase
VSNAFFKREKNIYYEHTPLLLGLIEFIMHDITYSMDSSDEVIKVTMPDDEEVFDKNTTFKVSRTKAVAGTGESITNPRENVNMASTWLDISSLYGSTEEVGHALRSFQGGKLLTQELKTGGASRAASYLPFNTMNVPMRAMPGQDPRTLFTGGDPRTNEDWLLLAVHTLILREHNRLCDILAKQHPEYDDEQIYQTVRLLMSAKYALIANAYQMCYWNDEMPWPRDDGK